MRFLSFIGALALSSPIVFAQSFTPVREQKNLSPAALEKLHTLETLNALPGGAWRFHAGDIPHGESSSLDDSSWPLVNTPEPRHGVKSVKEAVWYRRTIEVPKTLNGYDLSGSRIWFQFRASANGPMPQIVYFNGRRVALGDDLEPIVLFEPAHPGEKVLVAVKLLQTVDDKTFQGVNMKIEPLDTARPNPDNIRVEAITAANLLPALPKPRKDLLPTVESAVAAIDTNALKAGNQKAFDESLRKAQSLLAPLHSVLATDKVDLTGNAHIDAAWLWPKTETVDVVKRTFTTALQLMNEYPDYTYSQSASQYNVWMAEKYPELNKQIAQRVKEGRWEIVGGMWVEPDLNLPGGEALVRQLLVGQRAFKDLYNVTARIGWNPDSFGYNWQLPQIYKRSGLDYFVTQKMHWNDTNQLPFRLFWWESPDGSKVLTYFPTDYTHDNVSPTRISADFAESAERNPGTTEHMDLYGLGDHGGGPTRDMLDQADHWIAASKDPQQAVPTTRYSTAQHYFDSVEKHINPASPTWDYDKLAKGWTAPAAGADGSVGIPTWNSELYFEYHRGIMTTQAKHKYYMRRSEQRTIDAEEMASLAWLDHVPYPAATFTSNWRQISFNQFHDLAAGSGIGIIYKDAEKEYNDVFNEDHNIVEASLSTIAEKVDTTGKSGVPALVFNTMAWPRTDLVSLHVELPQASNAITVTDAKGNVVPTQITDHIAGTNKFSLLARVNEVPALGYTVLHAESSEHAEMKPSADLHVEDNGSAIVLSNAHLKATIDKSNGCIVSLTAQGAEYIAPRACGNQLQTYVDKPKQYDAWNVDPGTFDVPFTPIDKVDSIKVVDDGALRKTVRIERTWSKSHFTQDISLDAGAPTVRVTNDIDWNEEHVLLKAAFPLAASGPKATFEIPFGAIERPTTRANSWEKAQFEVPAMRWADLGDAKQGVSILNDSKYGYDAIGNSLRLTLLRSPTWPDEKADIGQQHFVYEIYPHAGSWQKAQTVQRGYELNTPLTSDQTFSHTGSLPATHSFVSIAEPNVILSAVKKAEDTNALIFRVYEATGQGTDVHLHVPAGATGAKEVNLMEAPIANAAAVQISGDTVTLPIKPWEIRTLEVTYAAK
jgi:alpha-mannosidase